MYSSAVDVEVEDKSDPWHLKRLVRKSMRFRTMGVRGDWGPPSRRLRMSRKRDHSKGFKSLRLPSVVSHAWNGGVAQEEGVLLQRGVPRPCKVDSESEAKLDTPFGIKCCRHGRFERQTDLFTAREKREGKGRKEKYYQFEVEMRI
ncbi:hypothetical protein K438DRAFT_1757770 [Mycena galopus ATCC 62051]|nr:hypothetical protein K438DRAFT_1757770 [Mycena galopus ATCC 62051]